MLLVVVKNIVSGDLTFLTAEDKEQAKQIVAAMNRTTFRIQYVISRVEYV